MAKRPTDGKCVHCLRENVPRNWDHVLPESWYPDSTPRDLEKWKIPSCIPCNSELGRIEEDLLMMFALCVDPKDPRSQGLFRRTRESLDPSCARNDRDRRARDSRRIKLLQNMTLARDSLAKNGIVGIYPGLPAPTEEQKESGIPMFIPTEWIRRMCEKFIRGHVFLNDGLFIEPPFTVAFYAVDDEGASELRATLRTHGEEYPLGEALLFKRIKVHDNGFHAAYEIQIWGQVTMFASVSEPT